MKCVNCLSSHFIHLMEKPPEVFHIRGLLLLLILFIDLDYLSSFNHAGNFFYLLNAGLPYLIQKLPDSFVRDNRDQITGSLAAGHIAADWDCSAGFTFEERTCIARVFEADLLKFIIDSFGGVSQISIVMDEYESGFFRDRLEVMEVTIFQIVLIDGTISEKHCFAIVCVLN